MKTLRRIGKVLVTLFIVGVALVATILGLANAEQPFFWKEVYVQGNTVADGYDSAVPEAWFHLAVTLVQETPGYSQPVAARAFGYIGVTLYESVVPGMPGYQSLAGQLNGLEPMPPLPPGVMRHWPTVANTALAESMRRLFPTATAENLAAIDALEQQFEAEFKARIRADVVTQSVAQGRVVATRIFEWSQTDGAHEGYLDNQPAAYVPPVGAGLWVATPPQQAPAYQPFWGDTRTMRLVSVAECPLPAPSPYSVETDSVLYREGLEVYNTIKNLTPAQRDSALYWAENPSETLSPPSHLISIVTQVLQQGQGSLALAAITYARVGVALNDAYIATWFRQYQHNRLRPISYIQQVIDPTWNSPDVTDPIITPPFPAYPSPYSVSAGATMTVLNEIFGEAFTFTDRTHVDRGLAPRTFTSFMQAAEEATLAQLYGGGHFRSDSEAGLAMGKCIGTSVNGLKLQK